MDRKVRRTNETTGDQHTCNVGASPGIQPGMETTAHSSRIRAAIALSALTLFPCAAHAQWCPAMGPELSPRSVGASVTLAGLAEPGERLHVDGRVLQPDGTTPATGVTLFLYQTDHTGVYPRSTDSSAVLRQAGRLHGWARTDAAGRYSVETIRPAPYPGRRDPAHIHVEVMPPGGPSCYVDAIEFDDDPLLTAAQRARRDGFGGSGIVKPVRDANGIWRATHTITLWPTSFTVPLRVDVGRSEVRWVGTKFNGRGRHEGTINMQPATLQLGGEALLSGTLTFPIASLEITDIPAWEPVPRGFLRRRLLGEQMFDAERFPTATLRIDRAVRSAPGQLRIFASLTIRDSTRNIAFDARLLDPPEASVVAESEFSIDRHLWGLSYRGSEVGNDLIDDDIVFRVRLVARRADR